MLFNKNFEKKRPIAYRLRPKKISDYVGQDKLLGEQSVLGKLISKEKMVNCIFYGPPGVGKTSLAELISKELNYYFIHSNATNLSVSDIKEIAKKATENISLYGKQTILFLDEIHRFNKLQQDSLLPHTENGTIVLIGASTENPYYTLNNSLLSRCMVFEFEKLSKKNIKNLLEKALIDYKVKVRETIIDYISEISDGDARNALNILELIVEADLDIDLEEFKEIFKYKISYDKKDDKYNTISAFIKSIRGSDPSAATYWLAKMLEGGEDPEYIARRLYILAAEDIGLANPDALNIAASAMLASKNIGMPEIRIILSEATVYMAISSKSNSVYMAINDAINDIKSGENIAVPHHLKKQGEKDYLYPHSYSENFVKQEYISGKKQYYVPGNNKNERLIKEKLLKLWGKKYEY